MRGSHAELVRHGMRAGSDRRRVAEGLLGSSDEARRAELEGWCLGCGLFVCKGVSMMGCVIITQSMWRWQRRFMAVELMNCFWRRLRME